MKLYIKNMVCDRCKMVVKTELAQLGFNPVSVQLGIVEIPVEMVTETERKLIQKTLEQFGFELLIDKKKQLAEQVKTEIIALVHYAKTPIQVNLSDYLSEKLAMQYPNLSVIFSEIENQTIEKFFIHQKIEKVKELLTYGEKSLSEIAFLLNYSSVAHLSTQFKKVSGKTPSAYKSSVDFARKTLDRI